MHCREGMMREIYSKLLHGLLQHVAPKPSPPQAPHLLTSQIPNPQILKTAQALQPGMSQAYHEVLKLKHESSCEVLKPRSPLLEPLDSLHSYEIHKHMYTHTYAPNIYIYMSLYVIYAHLIHLGSPNRLVIAVIHQKLPSPLIFPQSRLQA